MTVVYREELQNIIQCTLQPTHDIFNKDQCTNTFTVIHNEISIPSKVSSLEMSNEFSGDWSSKMLVDSCNETKDDNDVIYDNLVIRYT